MPWTVPAPSELCANFHVGPVLGRGIPLADLSAFIILNGANGHGGGLAPLTDSLLEFYLSLSLSLSLSLPGKLPQRQMVASTWEEGSGPEPERIAKGISSVAVDGSVRAWGGDCGPGGLGVPVRPWGSLVRHWVGGSSGGFRARWGAVGRRAWGSGGRAGDVLWVGAQQTLS